VLGCLAYVLRFAVFAIARPETRQWVVAANALHGLCYGFFFAGAYIYVEKVASADIRHSAQTVFGIIILGLGPVLAGFYNQFFERIWPSTNVCDQYSHFWWIQSAMAVLALLVLAAAFPRGQVASTTRHESGFEALPAGEGT
jgi:hypothetical protein